MRSYSIGEISKMFNLPISTLRYYDKEGLFPDLQRYGDRRLFTDYEIEALHIIECLKASGLGIKCWYYKTAMKDGSEDRVRDMMPDKLPPEIQENYNKGFR